MADNIALLAAAETGQLARVAELLSEGTSARTIDQVGHTALHKAAFMGFEALARLLVTHDPGCVDACDVSRSTALHVAAFSGNAIMTSLLLDARAQVSAADLAGNTPLHRSALEGHVGVAEVLLANGADVAAVGTEGSTPLHFAALTAATDQQLPLAQLLMRFGASPHLPNRHGRTASDLALYQGRSALAQALQEASVEDRELMHSYQERYQETVAAATVATGSGGGPEAGSRQAHAAVANGSASTTPSRRGRPSAEPQTDVFEFVLDALQASSLRRLLTIFHGSHGHKFRRNEGGDYPIELSALHAQFASLVSQHLERQLGRRGLTWEAAAAACGRAALDGRCSALRLRIMRQLAAVDDFLSFFELMAQPSLPGGDFDGAGAEGDLEVAEVEEAAEAAEAEEAEAEAAEVNDPAGDARQGGTLGEAAAAPASLAAAGEAEEAGGRGVLPLSTDPPCTPQRAEGNSTGTPPSLTDSLRAEMSAFRARALDEQGRYTPDSAHGPDYSPVVSGPLLGGPMMATLPARHGSRRGSAETIHSSLPGSASVNLNVDDWLHGGSRPESTLQGSETLPSTIGSELVSEGATSTNPSSLSSSLQGRPSLLEGSLRLSDGTISQGRWWRGRRIGIGSTGEVYLARDEPSGVDFAAKLVSRRLAEDEESSERLESELAILQSLRHPHIVEYLGAATCGTDSYILLELMAGGSVRQLLDKEHPTGLPPDTLHRFGEQLLVGLHYLHTNMIIHRDLKSENVLLDATKDSIKIADFGSSHELEGACTLAHETAAIRGSPYWMSPEHICGARCGRKADVWSYGAVLLEMLTGKPPWHDGEAAAGQFAVFQLLNRIVSEEGPPPMPPAEEMTPGLHALLLRCFERDLDARPTTGSLLTDSWVTKQW